MGIDAATGDITFDDGRVIGQATASGTASTTERDVLIDGAPFVVVTSFKNGRLSVVRLTNDDPRFGASWQDIDVEALRTFHDDWLRRQLGRGRWWRRRSFPLGGLEYRYRWGTVGSYMHPQDMAPVVVVTYA